jgi:hypothetical protein
MAKQVVIEVRNEQFCEVFTDDPSLEIVLVDWNNGSFERGDHFVHEIEPNQLVLTVPHYPTTRISKLPDQTRCALERAGILNPTISDTD